MAQGATLYTFDIDLADADRAVYESLALRVARHPSESEEYLVTRVLALRARAHRRHRVFNGRPVFARRTGDHNPRSHRRAALVD